MENVIKTNMLLKAYLNEFNELIIPEGVAYISAEALSDVASKVEKVVLPKSLKQIESYAFSNCTKLEQIIVPENCQYVGNFAFENCKNLKDVKFENKSTIVSRSAFYNCETLQDIYENDISVAENYFSITIPTDNYSLNLYKQSLLKAFASTKIEHNGLDNSPYFKIRFNGNNINPEDLMFAKELISFAANNGIKPKITIFKDELKTLKDKPLYYYNAKECEMLNSLNMFLQTETNSLDNELMYEEARPVLYDEDKFKHSNVIEANKKLDEICEYIKMHDLSPFETVLFIHRFAGNFAYNPEKEFESLELSRTFVTPLSKENPEIVCVGYASLVKAIIDRLNIPELKCSFNTCNYFQNKKGEIVDGGHANNIIKITDDKYGICGTYMEDATFDAATNKANCNYQKGFSHCLFSLQDAYNVKKRTYHAYEISQNEMSTYIKNEETQKTLKAQIEEYKQFAKDYDFMENSSSAISYNTFYDGIYNLLNKVNETEILIKTDRLMELSKKAAIKSYNKGCTNAFYEKGIEEKIAIKSK